MMVRGGAALLALAVAVAGCRERLVYGPKLTNAYGFDVVVTVDFDDGRTVTTQWPACRTAFFGGQRMISRLVIEKAGKTLLSLSATQVRDLERAFEEGRGGNHWMVDSTGVHRTFGDIACNASAGVAR